MLAKKNGFEVAPERPSIGDLALMLREKRMPMPSVAVHLEMPVLIALHGSCAFRAVGGAKL